jgi:type VI secretion system protein ImpK
MSRKNAPSNRRTIYRDMLADTAVQVNLLAEGGQVQSASDLHSRALKLVTELERKLTESGAAEDVRDEIIYAQCGLLDESALVCLPPAGRTVWEAHPLQVERFGNHDAGERVFANLAARLAGPTPDIAVLEFYACLLGLGFRGRYARAGDAKRLAIITALDERIESLSPYADSTFLNIGGRRRGLLASMSPWAMAILVCAMSGGIYLICGLDLDSRLGELFARKS